MIGVSSIMVSDSATKAPLVFSKWPPYPNSKSSSLRHQIFQHLRSSGRIPQNTIVKRYPPAAFMMRPMKYAQLKKTPIAQPSYYRPSISTPPRYRFHGSAAVPNPDEYIYENPFNTIGFVQVCANACCYDFTNAHSIFLLLCLEQEKNQPNR